METTPHCDRRIPSKAETARVDRALPHSLQPSTTTTIATKPRHDREGRKEGCERRRYSRCRNSRQH
ncbi:hypothetical protein E2C01_060536 [Portunus trituberculatus]|uniref:Uncharacterized protein n=1 Tax=Portunus trituberculatus TaxID=210409 RepID=A0A5B7H9B4_PORTR|nr:hypothetical protein [Portunus trituberculatus]